MTHKLKRPVAFLSAFVMVMAMLLYFPGGTSGLDFGLKASAATITPTEPSKGTDGEYLIGTAAELYWFAKLVNSGNTSANAVITANIVVNTGVLKSDGTLADDASGFTSWTPIGTNTNIYTGTFDGQGHTISGLYLNDADLYNVGLFGEISGTVKNVDVINSYFNGKGSVGGVCGCNLGTITNCRNTGTVSGPGNVGGVCGHNLGTITNCYNTGIVSGNSGVGGVCGDNYDTITNCYNTGTVSGTGNYIGGVCGDNRGTITNCYNTGTVSGTGNHIGGVCGDNYDTITNCYNTGAISGNSRVGGVCGYNGDTITNCYNTGTVSGTDIVGGVCGYNRGTITNCYNTGTVSGNSYIGGVCGHNYYGTITNCYYNSDKYSGNAVGGGTGTATNVVGKTTKQFASGEVAYLLNGSTSEGTLAWGQKIGTDDAPVLGSETVVYATAGCMTYNNDGYTAPKEHNYTFTADVHSCIDCGLTEKHNFGEDDVCTNCNTYVISTADRLYEFADKVNGGDININAVLTDDITVNTGVLKSDGTLADDASSFRIWTPILNSTAQYTYAGTFDGQGHTISGLYLNDADLYNVGLFGKISGTVKNVGVIDSYFNGKGSVGGVCGYNYHGTITNCYNTGTISGNSRVGGVCGYSTNKITNCYNTGTVSGTDTVGGVCGYNRGTITNCYNTGTVSGNSYIGGVCGDNNHLSKTITNCYYNSNKYIGNAVGGGTGTATNVVGKTTKQFASGEVAYLLNDSTSEGTLAWGQEIGTDDAPVLGGAKVYQVNAYEGCEAQPGNASTGYSNTNAPVYAKHNMTEHPENSATCTEAGNHAYWTCSYEKDVYYKNAEGTKKFASLSATVIPALKHNMTAVQAKDPTCTEAGNYAYWTCSREKGVYYKNAEGTEKFASLSATVIAVLKHNDTDNDGYCDNGCGQPIHSILTGVSATLAGDIGLNYYIALPKSVTADEGAYVQFTVNGQNTTVFVRDVTAEENGTYKFTCWLAAKEMRDNVTFKLYDGNGTLIDIYKNNGDIIEGASFDCSLETYLNKLSSTESDENAALKNLADATLLYGAYAQIAFNHNPDLSHNGSELADVTVDTLESNKIIKSTDIPEGLNLTEMTLILETETTLRLYFKSDNIENYTFKLDGIGVTLNKIEEEGLYYVEIANISAKDLDTMHTLIINDNCTLTFNALSYAYSTVKAGADNNICNVVKALYKYNDAANAYFGE